MPSALLLLASVLTTFGAATAPAPTATARAHRHDDAPTVQVWLSGGDRYSRGQRTRVHFRTDNDAFVTVVRVDTDGRMSVLFPESPGARAFVEGGRQYSVATSQGGFVVDDDDGLGYVFAIGSYDRLNFRQISDGHHWQYGGAGYVRGDPFVAMSAFAERLLWNSRDPYAMAHAGYYVERYVDYPRFACYDCHAGSSSHGRVRWDPYGHRCSQVRVIVYDDPDYYPYARYPGRSVVYTQPPRPRYEFKEVSRTSRPAAGTPEPFVERRRQTNTFDTRRPGAPAEDPNIIPRRTGGNPGSTRPGDDVDTRSTSRRRTVDDGGEAAGGTTVFARTRGNAGATRPGDDVDPRSASRRRTVSDGTGDIDSHPVITRPRRDTVSAPGGDSRPENRGNDGDGRTGRGKRRGDDRDSDRDTERDTERRGGRNDGRNDDRNKGRNDDRNRGGDNDRGEGRSDDRNRGGNDDRGEGRKDDDRKRGGNDDRNRGGNDGRTEGRGDDRNRGGDDRRRGGGSEGKSDGRRDGRGESSTPPRAKDSGSRTDRGQPSSSGNSRGGSSNTSSGGKRRT